MTIITEDEDEFANYKQLEYSIPFQGYRRWVAFAYIGVNAIGFSVNFWVLYTVAPLLFSVTAKVPKSILFYIVTLCISDLMIMIGMLFLITDIVIGTWKFSTFSCVAYLVFEAMNKFVAPVIVVLISRTCYVTICLDPESRRVAASLKCAVAQVIASMTLVMIMLWPLFAYSQVSTLYFNANITQRTVNVLRKCTFMPPPGKAPHYFALLDAHIELGFGIVSCIASYAIPLGGMIYWYVSVPFFLRRHAANSLTSSNYNTAALRRLIATVLLLTTVYISCWSPYCSRTNALASEEEEVRFYGIIPCHRAFNQESDKEMKSVNATEELGEVALRGHLRGAQQLPLEVIEAQDNGDFLL
ncbi:unnamed protein product [Litomosoides sigmodontis]|uniref:G-protein coupled receptors family 1 profile domain-containing protein n=1 Tax=Litomosoides sigmodontis TaxID=42156 RepID=A0A3P6T898_LITSI|nr:unnamed protein product [Litomosoides sigmodontis]